MNKPTIAVLGATGFVGGQVLTALSRSGYRLRAGYRDTSIRWHVEEIKCEWLQTELERSASVRRLVRGAQAVIDCAGYIPKRSEGIGEARRRGVARLRTVLDACQREEVRRVVYLSSAATTLQVDVKDSPRSASIADETSLYIPGSVDDSYVETKAAMEAELYRYIASGLEIVVALPTGVFGPGDIKGRAARFIDAVNRGEIGSPEGLRVNISDGRDLAQGIITALQRGRSGRRYLLGGNTIGYATFVESIARLIEVEMPRPTMRAAAIRRARQLGECVGGPFGCAPLSTFQLSGALELRAQEVSSARATAELGYHCRALDETITDTIRWCCRVGYLSWRPRGAMELGFWRPQREALDR